MPFIKIKVNCPVSRKQEIVLKDCIGKAIELVPGKSEEYLLLEIEDNAHIWLRGSDEPAAYIEAAVFGNETHAGYPAFTAAVTDIFLEVLDIPGKNLYIRYEDITAWSVSGHYIDRRMFG